ncbi:hypothetical protein [Tissierella sp.]|uniref:hypothetical protein n=1 Tax=Tissierella sp. TaxID=41274 RepID=UPI003F9B4F8C
MSYKHRIKIIGGIPDMELSEQAKKVKREYLREWRKKNKDKVAEHQKRYWEKKAREEQANK